MKDSIFENSSLRRKQLLNVGGWLPLDDAGIARHLTEITQRMSSTESTQAFAAPIADFNNYVTNNPLLRMTFLESITQAKENRPEEFPFTTIEGVVNAMNTVMTMSPKYDTTDLVGCPLNAVVNWPMCTTAGFAFFRDQGVNEHIKNILNYWSTSFLATESSCVYLNDKSPNGWWCKEANQYIKIEEYAKYDPTKPNGGFSSWNDFFTKEFKEGVRPVAGLNDNTVVVTPCESGPLQKVDNVKEIDSFWIKGTNYSLIEMFGPNPNPSDASYGTKFIGGTVYQAFLSALHYHRWRAPVSGKVIAAYNLPGTYYSDVEYGHQDPGGPNNSQPYLSIAATRSVLVIQPDGAPEGAYIGCLFVGMAEVSSCNLTVKAGDTLVKGQPVGYFQFGGSTHCLVFDKRLDPQFDVVIPNPDNQPPLKVCSKLATITL
ncbi:MAG: phophatidylserine decarboxylase associated domain-containing protein [Pseudomonadota bacterium]